MDVKLMIVEDEVIVAKSLSLTLTELGYTVADHVLSGEEAIRKAGELSPDLILMDIILQNGTDGITAAAEIRRLYQIPVIYLTAYADDETITRAQHTEPLGYIVKPFEPEDVHAAIEIGWHKYQVERKLKADLEARIRERTRELQTVVRELESFSYTVSHDLKAPLRAINSFASILFEEQTHCLDSEGQRHLTIIMQNAQFLGKLVDELLAFSKLSLQPMETSVVDMNRLVRLAYDELRRLEPPERAIEFSAGNLPEVPGSELLLRQVFANLLGNALKFTRGRNPARITVDGRRQEEEYIFSVRDNGVGFDPQYAEKAFEIFRRLHGDGDQDGSGVGLAIVKRIVARHGGRVWADAEEGKGATFYFSLPAETAAQRAIDGKGVL